MEATDENNLMNPDSAIEIQVDHNENASRNENGGIILNKAHSDTSDDDIALSPFHASIEEKREALKSSG